MIGTETLTSSAGCGLSAVPECFGVLPTEGKIVSIGIREPLVGTIRSGISSSFPAAFKKFAKTSCFSHHLGE